MEKERRNPKLARDARLWRREGNSSWKVTDQTRIYVEERSDGEQMKKRKMVQRKNPELLRRILLIQKKDDV